MPSFNTFNSLWGILDITYRGLNEQTFFGVEIFNRGKESEEINLRTVYRDPFWIHVVYFIAHFSGSHCIFK